LTLASIWQIEIFLCNKAWQFLGCAERFSPSEQGIANDYGKPGCVYAGRETEGNPGQYDPLSNEENIVIFEITFFEHSGCREATLEICQGQRPWLVSEENSSREGRRKCRNWNRSKRPFRTHGFIGRFSWHIVPGCIFDVAPRQPCFYPLQTSKSLNFKRFVVLCGMPPRWMAAFAGVSNYRLLCS
jgi:hypothetical protein